MADPTLSLEYRVRLVARPRIAGLELELRSAPLTLGLAEVAELIERATLTYPTLRFTITLADELEEE